jgi:membrane fusion protein (multidrug efflux system)
MTGVHRFCGATPSAGRRSGKVIPRQGVFLAAGVCLWGLMVLSIFFVGGCSRSAPPPEEQTVVPVEVTVLAPRSLSETAVLTGVLEASRAVDVVSEVSGEVISIRKDLGDGVSRADILASVDKKIPRENLNQADAMLMAADAAYKVAQVDFQRDSTLFADGTSSQAIYEKSRLALTAAEAELLSARASRELAARRLADTDIRAPFAGYISRRDCEIGSYVAPGMPTFRVVDIDSLRLRLGVSQANLTRLKPGMTVRITAEALGDRVFEGRIRAVSPEADEMTRTFTVEVILANPEGNPLRDGLVVRATLVLDTHSDVLAVPREAILRQGAGAYVFVVEDSLAARRNIRLGALIDNHYVVDDGLVLGDHVVTVGMQNLRDGIRVLVESLHDQTAESKEFAL